MNKARGFTRGFTLIELLVVVSIIGLLAAILVPVAGKALTSARRTRAMTQIRDLEGGIKRYISEYNRMPVGLGEMGGTDSALSDSEQAALVFLLINSPDNPDNEDLNPRGLAFLDLDPAAFNVKTVAEMVEMLDNGEPYPDPWGNPFGILLDMNFDDRIEGVGVPVIRAKVGVYSLGDPEKGYTIETTPYKTW